MFKKINAVLWIKGQNVLSNKSLLIQVLLPFVLVFLFQYIYSLNDQISSEQIAWMIVSLVLPMSYTMSAGTTVVMMMAEEVEKKTYSSLRLAGVQLSDYLGANLLIFVAISLLYAVAIPLIVGFDLSFNYFVVNMVTILGLTLLFLILGLFCKTQVMAQSLTLPFALLIPFLPFLATVNETLGKVTEYSFVGLFMTFIQDGKEFQLTASSLVIALAWLLAFLVGLIVLGKKGEERK